MAEMEEFKELGTLIVVVGKARNLVNKSRFGKQDPFCTLTYREDKQRTKPIKRGGQNPEWDEELRFTILEDLDDLLARSQSVNDNLASSTNSVSSIGKVDSPGVTTAQALATKSRKGPLNKKGGKSIRLGCYADDAKEPELIGECAVPIDEVLKKGEVDEWYDIMYKDKYSGEIYLELTFYSNDAPPVKRNVPRPPVNNYGGAGVFVPSVPSQHRLSGSITSSGSVSGMSLYIPPYVKPTDVAPAVVPPLQPSSSFQNLGVPPARPQQKPLPTGQPAYPPSHASVDNLSVDALTRPLSSLSLASNSSVSRPLPTATPVPQPQGHQYPHRHSVGGSNEAPWGSLLPQAQAPPPPAPHPRPMSTNDAVPWEQLQRMEEERKRAGATPVPRPVSGQGYHTPWQSQPDPYRGATPVPTGPASQLGPPAGPPVKQHANSFSGPSSQHAPPLQSYHPPPIVHSNSAPPVPSNSHYNVPTSSFGGIAQSIMEPSRSPSVLSGYSHSADPISPGYHQPTPPRQDLPLPPHYGTPTRQSLYPQQDAQPPSASLPTPLREPVYPPQHGYQQQSQPAYPSPPSQPQPSSSSSYVPWYQQTQPPAPPHPPRPQTSTPQPDQYSPATYGSQPPPIPSRRPIPNPPAPPKNPEGYWYPSDELYKNGQTSQPAPAPATGTWQPSSSTSSYANQSPNGYNPPYPTQPSQTPAPYGSPAGYTPHNASAPPPPIRGDSTGWQSTLPSLQDQRPSLPQARTPSPAPPLLYSQAPPASFYTPPSQPYRAPSPQPYRAPSPQPPPQLYPPPSQLNLPPSTTARSSSPSPSAGPSRQDWKSYMQNLSVDPTPSAPSHGPSAGIGRSPSPAPPPKDWYTPPPTLPSSIRPPDGWKTTLPPEQQNQGWR